MQHIKASTVSKSASSMIYSMHLVSMYAVIVGFFEAQGALQAHTTPRMWMPSDRAIINRVTSSPLFRQWERNRCSVIPILNGNRSSPASSVDVSLEHSKGYCYGSFQTATREGKPNKTFILEFFYVLENIFQTFVRRLVLFSNVETF